MGDLAALLLRLVLGGLLAGHGTQKLYADGGEDETPEEEEEARGELAGEAT